MWDHSNPPADTSSNTVTAPDPQTSMIGNPWCPSRGNSGAQVLITGRSIGTLSFPIPYLTRALECVSLWTFPHREGLIGW